MIQNCRGDISLKGYCTQKTACLHQSTNSVTVKLLVEHSTLLTPPSYHIQQYAIDPSYYLIHLQEILQAVDCCEAVLSVTPAQQRAIR